MRDVILSIKYHAGQRLYLSKELRCNEDLIAARILGLSGNVRKPIEARVGALGLLRH